MRLPQRLKCSATAGRVPCGDGKRRVGVWRSRALPHSPTRLPVGVRRGTRPRAELPNRGAPHLARCDDADSLLPRDAEALDAAPVEGQVR